MMKSSKANQRLEEVQAIEGDVEQFPDFEKVPPEEEADTDSALLRRIADRGDLESASFAYQELEEDDYVDGQALHRIVEDLQFGHDLRL
jgi:hypothetical protein